MAQQYFDRGKFYWNSGIFVWRAQTILDALGPASARDDGPSESIAAARDKPDYQAVLEREFAAIRPVSIDYAVMERAVGADSPAGPSGKVLVVEAPFEWDDVGSWQAIGRLNAGRQAMATWFKAGTSAWPRRARSCAPTTSTWW